MLSTDKPIYRCSRLPLLLACGGAAVPPMVSIEPVSEPAELGTEAHSLLSEAVEAGGADPDGSSEAHTLARMGLALRRKIYRPPVPTETEVAFADEFAVFILTGNSDEVTGNYVDDWKTGRVDSDYSAQLKGYALLLLRAHPGLETVVTRVLWLREQEVDQVTVTRAQAAEFERLIVERVVNWDGVLHPGKHCHFCPRSHECAGKTHFERMAVRAFLTADLTSAETVLALPPEERMALYQQAKLVSGLAETVIGAVRESLTSGPLSAGGRTLTLVESQTRKLSPLQALPVINSQGFSDEEIASCVSISIEKVKDLAAKHAPPRGGASAKRGIVRALTEAGAVSHELAYRIKDTKC